MATPTEVHDSDSRALKDRLSTTNLQHNNQIINNSRTLTACVAGCIAGIIGLTGWWGLLFYLFAAALTSGFLFMKSNFDPQIYFQSWTALVFDGVSGAFLSYLLFWTLAYNWFSTSVLRLLIVSSVPSAFLENFVQFSTSVLRLLIVSSVSRATGPPCAWAILSSSPFYLPHLRLPC
eukprot:g5713.t1